jgi:hypothetical protein
MRYLFTKIENRDGVSFGVGESILDKSLFEAPLEQFESERLVVGNVFEGVKLVHDERLVVINFNQIHRSWMEGGCSYSRFACINTEYGDTHRVSVQVPHEDCPFESFDLRYSIPSSVFGQLDVNQIQHYAEALAWLVKFSKNLPKTKYRKMTDRGDGLWGFNGDETWSEPLSV